MKSVKLTREMRENIRDKVLEKVIYPLEEENKKALETALESYLRSLVPEVVNHVPITFLFRPEKVDLRLKKDGEVVMGDRIRNVAKVPVEDPSRNYSSQWHDVFLDMATPWGEEFRKLFNTTDEIASRKANLNKELMGLLYVCNTTAQLIEKYPDIKNYVVLDTAKSLPVPSNYSNLTALLRG